MFIDTYMAIFSDYIYFDIIDSNVFTTLRTEDLASYKSPILIQFYRDYAYIMSHSTIVPYRKNIYNAWMWDSIVYWYTNYYFFKMYLFSLFGAVWHLNDDYLNGAMFKYLRNYPGMKYLSAMLYYSNALILFLVILLFLLISPMTSSPINDSNVNNKVEVKNSFTKNFVLITFLCSFGVTLYTIYTHFFFTELVTFGHILGTNYELFPELIDPYAFIPNSKVNTSITLTVLDSVLIILCYTIGFFSLVVLGDRVWLNNSLAIILLLYFPLIILLLAQANSIVELFLYYELLMLPSVYLVNKLGYSNKSHLANLYFFIWTQIGSIIVLFAVLYINATYSTTTFYYIQTVTFSSVEQFILFVLIFLGFGVKVPIWPFHYWLTKVHVEAPSGFSMFLSGFLVKTAVVCFYKIFAALTILTSPVIAIIICVIGVLDASIKFWGQVDIKKLIAYATIQEMNCIFFLFLGDDSWSLKAGIVFLVAHGILSALMFYIIELVYKRYSSRSIYKVYGLSELYPNLAVIIWVMLVIFLGFPGTAKFFAEFSLISIFVEFNIILSLIFGFFLIFIGGVGFARCWFSVLYGHPGYVKSNFDLTSEELFISISLSLISLLSPIIFYFF